MNFMENYSQWLENDYFDETTKQELLSISGDKKEIEERFYKSLEFGTGGLRGIIGAGTNRINIYTVRKATQGLANFILEQDEYNPNMGVAIAYDSRRFSKLFATETALVLNANGIKSFLFDSLRPTPMLSFAVRELSCISGVVITASHNPPEYNGYKAYWSDGGQIPYPKDELIIECVNNVQIDKVKTMSIEDAKERGLFNIIGKEIDDAFISAVKSQSLNPDVIKKAQDLKIVYTPLHGAGNIPVQRVLSEIGFNNVSVVPEQELPDENFSTVSYPNPEDPKAFKLAIDLAKKIDADIIVGTDPDADRVGAVVKNNKGEYVILSGNMTGVLLTEYILSQRKAAKTLPKNATVISTIVSTNMTLPITMRYGVEFMEVLTGFKYIGEKIKEFETTNSNQFIFGFEESYGCLSGTYARDKDAVVATMLIAEMAAYYKTKNMSLYDGLLKLYENYGFYKESIESITLKGKDGIEQMANIMSNLRKNPPLTVGKFNVDMISDFQTGNTTNYITSDVYPTGLPTSNVLYYMMTDDSWFCIRPSGTEPKIKVYFGVCGDSLEKADEKLKELVEAAMKTVENSR